MSYHAVITRLDTSPHPNADRLLLGHTRIGGFQVVVGKDDCAAGLGLFFPSDGQLSERFCEANHLIGQWSGGVKVGGGFFDVSRRVRCQRFRGAKSEGFWIPLQELAWTGADLEALPEGTLLTALNGIDLCCRYETPATRRAQGQARQRSTRGSTIYFRKHVDTPQWRLVGQMMLRAGGVMYVTEKLHGTSGRYGWVLDDQPLPWWKRAVNRLLPLFPTRTYTYLNGSRNVILEQTTGAGFYGTHDFRYAAVKDLAVRKGETIYFELVGDVQEGQPIMPAQPITDKALKAQYGAQMCYRYGAAPGTCLLYLYRVTQTNEDGQLVELSWPQVQQRAAELGVRVVPTLATYIFDASADRAVLTQTIQQALDTLVEGSSTLDPSHIREGVVVRVESIAGTEWAKEKSFTFKVLEGIIKDANDVVDLEEVG